MVNTVLLHCNNFPSFFRTQTGADKKRFTGADKKTVITVLTLVSCWLYI